MGDADGHTFLICPTKHRSGKMMDVAVDDIVLAFPQDFPEAPTEGP
jgi:hypothetical protein